MGNGIPVYSMYDHYLVLAKVRKRLAVSKQAAQRFEVRDLISGS
jgi:hypothetical protein